MAAHGADQRAGAGIEADAFVERLLERGVADAITFPWGSIGLFGIDKVVSYHMDVPLYVTPFVWAMNQAKYDSLPPDLKQVIAAEDGSEALVERIREAADASRAAQREDPDGHTRTGVLAAIQAAQRLDAGRQPTDAVLAGLAHHLTDSATRDALYALAVGFHAARAEALWTLLARRLPRPWRLEALVLLAFSAYARGDGPLAGIALAEALECDGTHRMARMLDEALLSGMRPAQIRELALSGYRVADRVGVELPPRQGLGRRAG